MSLLPNVANESSEGFPRVSGDEPLESAAVSPFASVFPA